MKRQPPVAQRRLDAEQFAFVRAVLQGMSLRDAADRYLEPGLDLRLAAAQLRILRDELVATARRAHAYGHARALLIDMASLPLAPTSASKLEKRPSLEDFRERADPDGFYSEAELIELYAEQYPPVAADRRANRVARLRDRQRRALDGLERVLVQPPRPLDPPSSWIDPVVAARLEAVGLKTLQSVADWINQKGHGWWAPLRGIGETKARRVVDWFERNQAATGLVIAPKAHATPAQKRSAWQAIANGSAARSGIVPLERFAVPAAMDGSQGANRGQGGLLDAANDYAAIQAWLSARAGDNIHTRRAYVREAERLLLWAIFERRRALSSLTVDDAIAYREFLANPQPVQRWVGPKSALRMSPAWRPFSGPLSRRSLQYALTVLGSLFDWLVSQRYLNANPIAALPRLTTYAAATDADPDRLQVDADRYFTVAQWNVIRGVLRALPEDERGCRQRFIVSLAYITGLRLSELVDARIGRMHAELVANDKDQTERHVLLRVRGKGGKIREVPFPEQLEDLLNGYLATRRLPSWYQCQQQGLHGVRLVSTLTRSRSAPLETSLSEKQLYREVGSVLDLAAEQLHRRGMQADAEHLRRGSTHWLRHTFGRHSMANQVPPNVVQAILGHASLQTTTIYSSQGGSEAFKDVQKLARKRL